VRFVPVASPAVAPLHQPQLRDKLHTVSIPCDRSAGSIGGIGRP